MYIEMAAFKVECVLDELKAECKHILIIRTYTYVAVAANK